MKRSAQTSANLSFIQAFVLGRLRDNGPMSSSDFSGARSDVSGRSEWAMRVLNAMEGAGLAESRSVSGVRVFSITADGTREIADLPLTPRRMSAMPDDAGESAAMTSAKTWLRGLDPREVEFEHVVNAVSMTAPFDEAERTELERIFREINPAALRRAAFVTASLPDGRIAATTRAADRGEAGRIGLPGGKADPGELTRDAAARETTEEGWDVSDVDAEPYHVARVGDFLCSWYRGRDPVMRDDWMEKGRITPIAVDIGQLMTPELGNDKAMTAYLALLQRDDPAP